MTDGPADFNGDSRAAFRRTVYLLLILASIGNAVGRIWTVESALGKSPLLSANDRSRWSTVRALVDHGTYVIDDVIFSDYRAKKRDREWYTIDMVRHRGHDGLEHYYSSKPPLLATLLAWPYWAIKHTFGVTFQEHPFYCARMLLVISNVIPLAVYFVLLACLVERYGKTDWGRMFVMATATQATFLTTFAVTLNNHLPAAISVLITVHAVLPIWCGQRQSWWAYAVAGLFAAFAAANELPALSFFAVVGAALMLCSAKRTMLAFVPAAGIVAGAFFYTNYAAHGSLRPPYAHRQDGPVIAFVNSSIERDLNRKRVPGELLGKIGSSDIEISSDAVIAAKTSEDRWVLWDRDGHDRLAIIRDGESFRIQAWDNWYEYDRSYWQTEKTGVDRGEPSRIVYAAHILVGHHGIFSLSPVWLFSVLGVFFWARGVDGDGVDHHAGSRYINGLRGFAAMSAGLTFICLAFYIARGIEDRNYGGVTSGFRWMFWFIPMFLVAMMPTADRISQSRWLRVAAYCLLLISIITAAYASLNPWTHPWIYKYWTYLGWKT